MTAEVPDDPQERADKLRRLKQDIDRGMADIMSGRVREWDFGAFLREARSSQRSLKPDNGA